MAKSKDTTGATGPEAPPPGAVGMTGPAPVHRLLRYDPEATIYERIIAILEELPAIGKSQRNPEQNFMYRGHDDVLNALNPLLAKHGVFVVPEVVNRVTSQRTTRSGTTMFEVNLGVAYKFYGLKGDYVEASVWGEGTDMGDKSTNKAMTMAFKNVLAQVFAISTQELSDADGQSPEESHGDTVDRMTILPEGFRGAGDELPARLHEFSEALDPSVDWGATFRDVVLSHYGRQYAELTRQEQNESLARYANALDQHDPDTIVTTDALIESFAAAFPNAESVTIHRWPVVQETSDLPAEQAEQDAVDVTVPETDDDALIAAAQGVLQPDPEEEADA